MNGWSRAGEPTAIRVRRLQTGFPLLWGNVTSFDKINTDQSPLIHGSFEHNTSNLDEASSSNSYLSNPNSYLSKCGRFPSPLHVNTNHRSWQHFSETRPLGLSLLQRPKTQAHGKILFQGPYVLSYNLKISREFVQNAYYIVTSPVTTL